MSVKYCSYVIHNPEVALSRCRSLIFLSKLDPELFGTTMSATRSEKGQGLATEIVK